MFLFLFFFFVFKQSLNIVESLKCFKLFDFIKVLEKTSLLRIFKVFEQIIFRNVWHLNMELLFELYFAWYKIYFNNFKLLCFSKLDFTSFALKYFMNYFFLCFYFLFAEINFFKNYLLKKIGAYFMLNFLLSMRKVD